MSRPTVLFDFYNTLYAASEWFELEVRDLPVRLLEEVRSCGVDVSVDAVEAAARLYRRLREEVHSSGVEVSAETAAARVLESLGIERPAVLSSMLARLERDVYFPGRELPGAVQCVRQLHDDGYVMAVVSNALYPEFIQRSLDGSGLRSCFSALFTSAGTGWYKSSPELYRTVLRTLDAESSQVVHIGDSYRFDVLGAKAAGIRTVWLSTEDPCAGPEADAVVSGLSQVANVVRALVPPPNR